MRTNKFETLAILVALGLPLLLGLALIYFKPVMGG